MKTVHKLVSLFVLLALVLSACSTSAPVKPDMMEKPAATEAMMDQSDQMSDDKMAEEPMMEEQPAEDAMMDKKEEGEMMAQETPDAMAKDDSAMKEEGMAKEGEMMTAPVFFSAALTDAANGQVFSIQDFKGKVVLVETLAMWCSNCLKQQKQVKLLHEQLGERDDFISIGLDVDPNENLNDLKAYVAKNGFGWTYAVASAEVAREIGQLYGPNFLNPPSTPMFIVDRHGEVHPLPFGIKSADDLLKALEPFLNEGM